MLNNKASFSISILPFESCNVSIFLCIDCELKNICYLFMEIKSNQFLQKCRLSSFIAKHEYLVSGHMTKKYSINLINLLLLLASGHGQRNGILWLKEQ